MFLFTLLNRGILLYLETAMLVGDVVPDVGFPLGNRFLSEWKPASSSAVPGETTLSQTPENWPARKITRLPS